MSRRNILIRILQAVAILAVAVAFLAPSYAFDMPMLHVKKKVAAGGGGNFCDGSSALVCEDFDGVAACGDSSHTNCRVSWHSATGTYNFNSSDAGFFTGTYNLSTPLGDASHYVSFTASDEVYVMFKYTVTSATNNEAALVKLQNGTTGIGWAGLTSMIGNNWKVGVTYNAGGASTTGIADPIIALNTPYYLKLRYKKGTGANAIWDMWYSASPFTTWTRIPSGSLPVTNATDTAQIDRVYYRPYYNNGLLENFVVSTTDISLPASP